jgi:uncharacterized membrane protein YdbT with pleckstrin-like domain
MGRPAPHAEPPASSAPGPAPERVVARVRRHGRVLILPALLAIAVAGGAMYAVFALPEAWQRIAAGAGAAVVVLLGCVLPFLAWLTRRWTLTTRRIIVRSGVFTRVRQELLLARAHDVTVRRTPGQRLFGSGDVRVGTVHERPLILRDVPQPMVVQAALDELIDRSHRDGLAERTGAVAAADIDTVIWGTR